MSFIREAHHDGWQLSVLQRAEHLLAPRARGRSKIGVSQNQHERRLHIIDVADGRALLIVIFIFKWWFAKPRCTEQSKVVRVPPIAPTRDVSLRDRCHKSVGVA